MSSDTKITESWTKEIGKTIPDIYDKVLRCVHSPSVEKSFVCYPVWFSASRFLIPDDVPSDNEAISVTELKHGAQNWSWSGFTPRRRCEIVRKMLETESQQRKDTLSPIFECQAIGGEFDLQVWLQARLPPKFPPLKKE